jgi:hypothetical protein
MKRQIAVWVIAGMLFPAAASAQQGAVESENGSSAADLAAVQGKWESRDKQILASAAVRTIKEIKGAKEVITYFGPQDEILRVHSADFTLERSGRVRIFTWSHMEVLEGEGKGKKVEGPSSYIYRVHGDQLVEVGGMLIGQETFPARFITWKRIEH